MSSLRHTGRAIETTAMKDIPGVFMNRNGDTEMRAVLKEFIFHKAHNFNLVSMSRQLHMQGWKITHGDESLIGVENRKGKVLNFNILVPMEKWTVYACKFVCLT